MITVFGSVNLDLIGKVQRIPAPGETVPAAVLARARRQGRQPGAGGQARRRARSAGRRRRQGHHGRSGAGVAQGRRRRSQRGQAPRCAAGRRHDLRRRAWRERHRHAARRQRRDDPRRCRRGAWPCSAEDVLVLQQEIPQAATDARPRPGAASTARSRSSTPRRSSTRPRRSPARPRSRRQRDRVRTALRPGEASCSKGRCATGRAAAGRPSSSRSARTAPAPRRPMRFSQRAGAAGHPVDTVGAGDTFFGYLAAGLDAGLDLEAAMRRAAVAGEPRLPQTRRPAGRSRRRAKWTRR